MNVVDTGRHRIGSSILRGVVERVVKVIWLVSKYPSHCGTGHEEDLGRIGRANHRVLLLVSKSQRLGFCSGVRVGGWLTTWESISVAYR